MVCVIILLLYQQGITLLPTTNTDHRIYIYTLLYTHFDPDLPLEHNIHRNTKNIMAEYWKSTPKYWCKHCKTFVVDTKFARSQHESTGKHQGALGRFLRTLHRNNERETATKDAAKQEVARLEALTSGKPLLPSTSTITTAAAATTTTTKWATSTVRSLSEAEKKAQLKQLESLGVSLPEEFRKDVAMPGEWQEVDGPGPKTRGALSSGAKKQLKDQQKDQVKEEILRKRKAEEEARWWEEMDEDERAMRGFKVETKTYPADCFGGGEADALLLGLGKGKIKGVVVSGRTVLQKQQELAEDGKVVKKEEEEEEEGEQLQLQLQQQLPFEVAVKPEEEGEEGQKLSGGVVEFKRRKVKSLNLRKK